MIEILTSTIGSFPFRSPEDAIKFQLDLKLDIITDGQVYLMNRQDDYLPFLSNNNSEVYLNFYEIICPNFHSRIVIPKETENIVKFVEPEEFNFVRSFKRGWEFAEKYLEKKNYPTKPKLKFVIPSPLSLYSRFSIPLNWEDEYEEFLTLLKDHIIIPAIKSLIEYSKTVEKVLEWRYIQIDHPVLDDFEAYKNIQIKTDLKLIKEIIDNINDEYPEKKFNWIYYTPAILNKDVADLNILGDSIDICAFMISGLRDYSAKSKQINYINSYHFYKNYSIGIINAFEPDLKNEDPQIIAQTIDKFVSNNPFLIQNKKKIIFTPNIGLRGLLRKDVKKKLENMVNGVTEYKNKLTSSVNKGRGRKTTKRGGGSSSNKT